MKKNNYLFKIIWSQSSIGIAINQNNYIPLTSFYFWPREDGWTLLKQELDSKPWISKISKFEILNGYTTLITYWIKNYNKKTNIINQTISKINLNLEILTLNSID